MQKARRVCIYTKPDHGYYQVRSPRRLSRSYMLIEALKITEDINWRMAILLGFKLRKGLACVNCNYAFFSEDGIKMIWRSCRPCEMVFYSRGATQGIDQDL